MIEIAVAEQSQVAEARRRASAAATASGFDELGAARVALAATELATNLVKHGGGGRLLVDASGPDVALVALDRGQGMRDIARCLTDGYSTASTPGNGLGAVRRLASAFEVVSWPALGTAVFARIGRRESGETGRQPGDAVAGVVIAKPGETACGDAWIAHEDADGRTLLVVDGLGHGMDAAKAANAAVAQFSRGPRESPVRILEAVHAALRPTRGGAVGVASIRWASATVSFAGIGNIASTFVSAAGQVRRMVSHNGIAGHNARKIQAYEYPCSEGRLIMHSDGVGTSWNLGLYPGLVHAHPLLIAGVLYRDFARGHDDSTVVVADTGAASRGGR